MPRSQASSGNENGGKRYASNGNGGGEPSPITPGTTGRYLVLLRQDAAAAGIKTLTELAGLSVARIADDEDASGALDSLSAGEAIVFDNLAVAVVDAPPDNFGVLSSMIASEDNGIEAIEAEQVVYAIGDRSAAVLDAPLSGSVSLSQPLPPAADRAQDSGLPIDYLLGYRDAVDTIVEQVLRGSGAGTADRLQAAAFDESALTWGLQATGVAQSRYTGRGVRVAVLDTGFDFGHPDFIGRAVVARSFVLGEAAQDGHGHGTHCIGTACGPRQPQQLPRYGIAYDAEIYVGKVLSNRGSGTDSSILAGIQWAIANGCAVVSMSLGARTLPNQSYSRVYEAVAQRALAAGTLIVAAAGNDSSRPGHVAPVAHPANCPSIMAVASIDSALAVSFFSCGGVNLEGGQVDIAAPGGAVRSSWPRPLLYRTISGTSMATPHVAGVAALLAEQNPTVRGGALGWLLLRSAERLDLPSKDIGAGLVQAP